MAERYDPERSLDELRAARDYVALIREAARLMREEEAGSPTMVAVADLLQVLSWMPSIAHPADLDAAQRVARAYLGRSDE